MNRAGPGLRGLTTMLFLAFAAVMSPPSDCAAQGGEPRLSEIKMPPGFRIAVYARVPSARSLALSPSGTLYVGTRANRVYAALDDNKDLRADRVLTLASGYNQPNGVAFRNGSLYVAEIHRVLRFDNIENRLDNPPEPVVVSDKFPTDRSHGWKFIRFGPDGRLYVPVGAPCNICEPGDPYASITRMNPDGSEWEVYARGIRNTVGFDWHPDTGELWFTDNGRDYLGDDSPPDELNRITAPGQHFGYPYCHGGNIPDPEFGSKHPCSDFVPPAQNLGPHVAALGMRFYTGTMFPEEYRGGIFIAEHGSWNRSAKIGYRVMLVRHQDSRVTSYEEFATGWLLPGETVWGRPVDVEQMPDGSLLLSDDHSGTVYRITWESPVNPSSREPVRLPPDGAVEFSATDPRLTGPGLVHAWSLDGKALEVQGASLTLSGSALVSAVHELSLTVLSGDSAIYSTTWEVRQGTTTVSRMDFNGDGRVGLLDVFALMLAGLKDSGDLRVDYNGDGSFGAGDIAALLADVFEYRGSALAGLLRRFIPHGIASTWALNR